MLPQPSLLGCAHTSQGELTGQSFCLEGGLLVQTEGVGSDVYVACWQDTQPFFFPVPSFVSLQ
jgi:hypothetical protein